MPLILVQNELTEGGRYDHWQDNTGVQYHFPNQYINKIREGELFIYYKGSRRLDKKRVIPEYFGFGKIGKIWVDPTTDFSQPKKNLRWYCEIIDYIPFKSPVDFKINGKPFENISDNLWSVAVRNISNEVYHSILEYASVPFEGNEPIITPQSPIIPNINEVTPMIVGSDQKLLTISNSVTGGQKQKTSESSSSYRYSKYSKLYGDHSEELVYKMLLNNRTYKVRWVAKEKEKPGWDIEYDDGKNIVAVEVKGTSGKRFLNIEITAGEWKAAQNKGVHYNLYLVADCLSNQPKIQVINNPYSLYLNKQFSLDPLLYRLSRNK